MRTLVISAIIVLSALAVAAGPFDGTWAQVRSDCSAAYPETQVKISESRIFFIESSCVLENPTSVRDMPQGKLYDLTCSGEGMSWSDRTFIATDGDGLVIYNRGYASKYLRC